MLIAGLFVLVVVGLVLWIALREVAFSVDVDPQ